MGISVRPAETETATPPYYSCTTLVLAYRTSASLTTQLLTTTDN